MSVKVIKRGQGGGWIDAVDEGRGDACVVMRFFCFWCCLGAGGVSGRVGGAG